MLQRKLKAALAVPGEKRSDRFFRLFPWVWLAAAYCVTMLVLCLYGRNYIDSDMASDMVLAELLNQEGGVLSTQWWYSTELNVFCEQLVYRLGLALFPGDWYAARMVGQAFLLLLLILSYLYVGHGLRLKNCGAWGAAALACPFGVWYWWYGPFGGFYFPYMILLLLGFGSMLHLLRPAGKRRRILQWGFLLLVTGASGLNGLKGLMGFFVPMALTACLALGLQWHLEPEKRPRRESRLLVMAVLSLIVASAAYVFNSVFLTATHQYSNYNDRLWGSMNLETLLNKWMDFLSLFGYPVDSFLQGEVEHSEIARFLARLDCSRRAPLYFRWSGCCGAGKNWTRSSVWLRCCFFRFVSCRAWFLPGREMSFRQTRPTGSHPCRWYFLSCSWKGRQSTSASRMPAGRRRWPSACVSWLPAFRQECAFSPAVTAPTPTSPKSAAGWRARATPRGMPLSGTATCLRVSNGQIEVWVSNDFNTLKPYQWLQKTSHASRRKARCSC